MSNTKYQNRTRKFEKLGSKENNDKNQRKFVKMNGDHEMGSYRKREKVKSHAMTQSK